MNPEALDRLHHFLREQDLSAILLTSPFNVTWLTGYAPPIQTGPSPFEGGPAAAWVCGDRVVLIVSDGEAGAAAASEAEVMDYLSYTIDAPIQGFHNQAAALAKALAPYAGLAQAVGVEFDTLPAAHVAILRQALPEAALRPVDGSFDLLRAVKTPAEIDKIRAALALCDLAQVETRRRISPGRSEIEVWGEVKAAMEAAAGARLPVLADFVSGERTAEIGGLPGARLLAPGDAVIADIVPRLAGYWGDNAGTHFAGGPSAEFKKMYRTVLESLRRAVDMVKPGLRACDLDQTMRASISAAGYPVYPHHSGHGLGTSYHEEPRIVPYNPLALEAGMVVALEPGIYVPGVGGVRLEDVVLVTPAGCEMLTHHLDREE